MCSVAMFTQLFHATNRSLQLDFLMSCVSAASRDSSAIILKLELSDFMGLQYNGGIGDPRHAH